MDFRQSKNTRKEFRAPSGTMRAGRLQPVFATMVDQSEGGYLTQSISVELGAIPGRLLTPVHLDVFSVGVPAPAIDYIKDPAGAYAGMSDVLRQRLMNDEVLFGMEDAGLISNALDVTPVSIGGVKRVTEAARLAYNAAVNFLRRRRYVKASLVLHNNTAILPALFAQSALDKLNGVLDPEDRVNGMVEFNTGTITAPLVPEFAPLTNVYFNDNLAASAATRNLDGTSSGVRVTSDIKAERVGTANTSGLKAPVPGVDLSLVEANLTGLNVGSVSLQDFYDAQRMDEMVRAMRKMVDENGEYGEEMALRWALGLAIDTGKTPWLLAERTIRLSPGLTEAMDALGVNDEVMRTDLATEVTFTVPLPKTELGYVVVTIIAVRPDETLASQPHPFLTKPWGRRNYVAEEMDTNPKPVTVRDVYADCTAGEEATVVMYTGLNALPQNYQSYGFNRNIDLAKVANKTAIWQVGLPLSVTPESFNYPANLTHYPFALNGPTDEPITYVMASSMVLQTPMPVGPTPVEELAVLETSNVFED